MSRGLPTPDSIIEAAFDHAVGGETTVVIEDDSQAEVRFANNKPTTNGVRRARSVQVVRYLEVAGGVAAGIARASGDVDIGSLVDAASADARSAGPAHDAHDLVALTASDDAGASITTTDLEAFSDVLVELGAALERADASGRILSGFMEHTVRSTTLASTTGLRRFDVEPTGALQLVASNLDRSATAWSGVGDQRFAPGAFARLEEQVALGIERARTRIDVEPGRQQVILTPSAVADMMVFLAESLGRREALEGRNAFSGTDATTIEGHSISSLPFTLKTDPSTPSLSCRRFFVTDASTANASIFDLGATISPTKWIDKGTLAAMITTRADGARDGVSPHLPGGNLALSLETASDSIDQMVAGIERGLLVNCLWYIREVDQKTLLLTGLTRDGVYVIEDGAIKGATTNFRFNESPLDLLARVQGAGASVRTLGREFGEWRNRTSMPPLLISDFNMSSVSKGV